MRNKKIKFSVLTIYLIHEGVAGYYVSEKVKREIEETGCTGIEFQPIEQG